MANYNVMNCQTPKKEKLFLAKLQFHFGSSTDESLFLVLKL